MQSTMASTLCCSTGRPDQPKRKGQATGWQEYPEGRLLTQVGKAGGGDITDAGWQGQPEGTLLTQVGRGSRRGRY
jgi:hypothetical protein